MALESAKPFAKDSQVGTSKPSETSKARRSAGIPKRGRKPRDSEASGLFKHIVCADDCLVEGNGPCEPPLQAAHVVPAAVLRARGLGHLVYDPSNAVALCYRHHRRHDLCVEKIPRHVLPARCFAWASAHNLTEQLERHWPAGEVSEREEIAEAPHASTAVVSPGAGPSSRSLTSPGVTYRSAAA